MSVDADTVRRIAHLARIAVAENEVEHLKGELNTMLAFVEQLSEVNVDERRADDLGDADGDEKAGGRGDRWRSSPTDIVKNAPHSEDNFFLVPKVVE